jgi:pimeloyl-ACP methyl ester carboxylesterase
MHMPMMMLLLSALNGYWSGSVTTPAGPLPIALSIAAGSVTLDAPGLGLTDKRLHAEMKGDTLAIEVMMDEQPVTAELKQNGEALRGNARAGAATYAVELHRGAAPPKVWRSENAVIENNGIKLAATLYKPIGTARAPAVVFVAGLTPRGDAAHFLATQFAARGIAVLTYDHRGIGASTGERRASFSDLADDAVAAIRWLRARSDIDPNRIGIRGQSQGAWIAPLAATRVPIAFVIATAGGGVQPWQSETYAIPARMRASGFSGAEIAEASRYMAALFEVGRTGRGWEELSAMMRGLRARNARWFGEYGSVPDSFARLQQTWKNEFSYDPLPALRALRVPLFAAEGEKDVYAPPDANVEVLRTTVKSPDVTISIVPGATHDFHVAGAPLPLVSQQYLSSLLDWTTVHAGTAAPQKTAVAAAVANNRVAIPEAKITIAVDPSLPFIGSIAFDIRDAAHANRYIFAKADASGKVQRLAVIQFEKMLPQHRGTYDARSENPRRIGPLTFDQATGIYNFAASIAAKPGLEAERTRDFLASKGMKVDTDLLLARFETLPVTDHRSELLLFYWQDLGTLQRTRAEIQNATAAERTAMFAGFAERARSLFTISAP